MWAARRFNEQMDICDLRTSSGFTHPSTNALPSKEERKERKNLSKKFKGREGAVHVSMRGNVTALSKTTQVTTADSDSQLFKGGLFNKASSANSSKSRTVKRVESRRSKQGLAALAAAAALRDVGKWDEAMRVEASVRETIVVDVGRPAGREQQVRNAKSTKSVGDVFAVCVAEPTGLEVAHAERLLAIVERTKPELLLLTARTFKSENGEYDGIDLELFEVDSLPEHVLAIVRAALSSGRLRGLVIENLRFDYKKIAKELEACTTLQLLKLKRCHLFDKVSEVADGLAGLGNLTELRQLSVTYAYVPELKATLRRADDIARYYEEGQRRMQEFHARMSAVRELPASFARLTKMESVTLSGLDVSSFSSDIALAWQGLRSLRIRTANLRSLPLEIANMPLLYRFELKGNDYGEIALAAIHARANEFPISPVRLSAQC